MRSVHDLILVFGYVGSFVSLSSFITVRQNGAFRKVTGKIVSRKDATAQRKTFLHFEKRIGNVCEGTHNLDVNLKV